MQDLPSPASVREKQVVCPFLDQITVLGCWWLWSLWVGKGMRDPAGVLALGRFRARGHGDW